MNSKMLDTGSKDSLNNLPDDILCHILSFLSTKDVILTSVLSKRWRYLLAFVPSLVFETYIFKIHRSGRKYWNPLDTRFMDLVDRILALQGNAPLNKFSLHCVFIRKSYPLDGWIPNVLDRGVLDLDLSISSTIFDNHYWIPSKVLMCKTLVRLKLGGHTIIDVEQVFLPKLKILYLSDGVEFKDKSGAAFAKLISSCHVLEELVINTTWKEMGFFSVSHPTLKRVTICCESNYENPHSVSFDTHNVVYLEFTDTIAIKYPKVKFDSLVEASIGLWMTPIQLKMAKDSTVGEEQEMVRNVSDFLKGISNVKILYLSSKTLEVLNFCCRAIPVFNKLIHLTIETDRKVGWKSLPNLLENCPNVETLVFKGLHYKHKDQCEDKSMKGENRCMCKPWEGTPICLSSSSVKILKVLKFGEISSDRDRETEVIKCFLETMPNLEQMVIYYDTPFVDGLTKLSSKLQLLEIAVASPKCKIQVISDVISFSSTVGSSSSANRPFFFKHTFPV